MKVLILGGDGFIGWNLAKFFKRRGDIPIILDKNKLRCDTNENYIQQEITAKYGYNQIEDLINTHKPDFVYNCIAVATPAFYVKHPVATFDLDFAINYEIIKAVLDSNVPLVHFSTSEVYGKIWNGPYKEDSTDLIIGPTHKSRWIYATSKILLEQLLYGHNKNFCIVRPQNFCGYDMDWLPSIPGNEDKHWIPRLPAVVLNALIYDEPIKIVRPGSQKRCYTHISDGVEALYLITQNWDKCNKQVLNIGHPGNEITVTDFARLLIRKWNDNVRLPSYEHDLQYVTGEELYGKGYEDCPRRLFSATKTTKALNWSAKLSVYETAEKMIKNAMTYH